jgi:ABC-2 type transport system ATP-binding protein
MVELEQVTKWYGRRRSRAAALRDVSLRVPPGSVWAVVGPNGAGKSTLLGIVLGFLAPSKGRARIGGELPRHHLRDEGAGYLPERFSLPAEWRVRDALRMFARLEGGSIGNAEQAASLFGLEPHLDKRTRELSRGLLQRVGLAQALLARRNLIVLDEPTEGLDPLWRIRLRDAIAAVRGEERTIIIASHDLAEVERVADRAVLLDGGTVREVLDLRTDNEPTSYRIVLAEPSSAVRDAFPDARDEPGGDHPGFTVNVAGPVELSQRISALLQLGGVIAAVEPLRRPLEQRVREALEDRP